jgi:hypothetical protein
MDDSPVSIVRECMRKKYIDRYQCLLSLGPETAAALILHSFRKPKRVRTAFTPAQLLKLENAFEKNHYVVGQERKELARHLNLTETQVSESIKKIRKC